MDLKRLFGRRAKASPLHLEPHPRGWALRPEGGDVAFVFRTKVAAMERGLLLAQRKKAELVVHDESERPAPE